MATAVTSQHQPGNADINNKKMLMDIGINLMHKQFQKDRDEVIQRALQQSNVGVMVLTGTSTLASKDAQEYCAQHHHRHAQQQSLGDPTVQLFFTAGVHPHDAKGCDENTIETLRTLATTPQVVAIGECGLDYNHNFFTS